MDMDQLCGNIGDVNLQAIPQEYEAKSSDVTPLAANLPSKKAKSKVTSLHDTIVARSARLLLDEPGCASCKKLTWEDIQPGKLLGAGGFCKVQEVTLLGSSEDSASSEKENPYALKRVKESLFNVDEDEIEFSFYQLKMEAKFLAKLSHENVIGLHAVGGGEKGAFLILDRLKGDLDSKLERLKKDQGMTFIFLTGTVPPKQRQQQKLGLEQIAVPIATAMKYLHSKLIAFRDLKPDNVGFGCDGKVKLFDFGLAAQIGKGKSTSTGLSGMAGTLRYMSPECFLQKKYGLPTDVYSFSMLLWEIMTLDKPFKDYFSDDLVTQKSNGNRPKLGKRCGPPPLHQLYKKCWDQDPAKRPTFAEIIPELDKVASLDYFNDVVHSKASKGAHSKAPKKRGNRRSSFL